MKEYLIIQAIPHKKPYVIFNNQKQKFVQEVQLCNFQTILPKINKPNQQEVIVKKPQKM